MQETPVPKGGIRGFPAQDNNEEMKDGKKVCLFTLINQTDIEEWQIIARNLFLLYF